MQAGTIDIAPGTATPAARPTARAADDQRAPTEASAIERSPWARGAIYAGIGLGITQNTVDVIRLGKKLPESVRASRFEPSLGRVGRLPTALGLMFPPRPDFRIIDPAAPATPRLESGGRSFTAFDRRAMKTSVLLGASLAGIQIVSGVMNLHDAVTEEGDWRQALLGTTSGRAGMLQLGGGLFGGGLFLTALHQTRQAAPPGVVPRIVHAGSARIMAWPAIGRIATGTALVVLANEKGYFDFLSRGEQREAREVLREAAQATPVLNDPRLRTAALLGAAGVVGYKAELSMRAAVLAGHARLAGVRPGHAAGGALVAGLLGAQLLGALRPLDGRP